MRITAIALLLGTLGLAACDDSNDPIIVPNVLTGTFTLQTVNGAPLAAAVIDSANPALRIDALSGTITINANGTFTDVTTVSANVARSHFDANGDVHRNVHRRRNSLRVRGNGARARTAVARSPAWSSVRR